MDAWCPPQPYLHLLPAFCLLPGAERWTQRPGDRQCPLTAGGLTPAL